MLHVGAIYASSLTVESWSVLSQFHSYSMRVLYAIVLVVYEFFYYSLEFFFNQKIRTSSR